jgi:hypothetical protein
MIVVRFIKYIRMYSTFFLVYTLRCLRYNLDLMCNLRNAIEVRTHIHQHTEEYLRTDPISV